MESTKNNSSIGLMDTQRQPACIPDTLTSEASGSSHRLQLQEAGNTVPFHRGAKRGLLTNTVMYTELSLRTSDLSKGPELKLSGQSVCSFSPELSATPAHSWSESTKASLSLCPLCLHLPSHGTV